MRKRKPTTEAMSAALMADPPVRMEPRDDTDAPRHAWKLKTWGQLTDHMTRVMQGRPVPPAVQAPAKTEHVPGPKDKPLSARRTKKKARPVDWRAQFAKAHNHTGRAVKAARLAPLVDMERAAKVQRKAKREEWIA